MNKKLDPNLNLRTQTHILIKHFATVDAAEKQTARGGAWPEQAGRAFGIQLAAGATNNPAGKYTNLIG